MIRYQYDLFYAKRNSVYSSGNPCEYDNIFELKRNMF